MKYSSPSADQLGWQIDSASPPATVHVCVTAPSSSRSAAYSVQPSHGMFGWSHAVQHSIEPSGLTRGDEKKSCPSTSTVSFPLPISTAETVFIASTCSFADARRSTICPLPIASGCSSRTATSRFRFASMSKSA